MPKQSAAIRIRADKVRHRLTPYLVGANLEDLNYQTMGGLYSQLIHGENFEEPGCAAVSGHWKALHTKTAVGEYALETQDTFNGAQSQRITFVSGRGEVGIDNAGLCRWGLLLRKGKTFEGLLRVKTTRAATVHVSLRSADGKNVYAAKALPLAAKRGYQRLSFELTPKIGDRNGRFAITLKAPGSISVGYAFLQPGPWGRFKGLPVRKDLARAIIAQGIRIMRYNGSMSTTPAAADYRWKEMIGPRDLRRPFTGTFNPFASHGWGIFETLDFCEAAGILAVPGLNMVETPGDLADFVEYCNGPATSQWGRRRADDGHPRPYHLRYLQLGNEQRIESEYVRQFKAAAKAIWAKDPEMTLVTADWMYWNGIKDPGNIDSATCTNLDAHVKLLTFARDMGGKLWWDVHVWEAGPTTAGVRGVRDLHKWFGKLVPDYDCPIVALEWNAGNHDMRRALGHACMHNELAACGSFVPAGAAPNTLQPWQQYTTTNWDQGQIYFTQDKVWYQPGAQVDIMVTEADCPDVVQSSVKHTRALSVSARRSVDGKTLSLYVANVTERRVAAAITVEGFEPTRKTATITELSGQFNDSNTLEEPMKVSPVKRVWRHGLRSGKTGCTFAPRSFAIVRFR